MIIRARAPLRLGLAGGASDVSPFCDRYGGYVLNATIDSYAYCHLEPTNSERVEFVSLDREERFVSDAKEHFDLDEVLVLHKAIYNRVVRQFNQGRSLSVRLMTNSDAPV